MKYFPIFTDLRDKSVLIIGQYKVLKFKLEKLLEADAKVTFLSNTLSIEMENYVNSKKITYINDSFKEKYLKNVWLVICGSNNIELKTKIAAATKKRNIFCNFVDEAPISSFISPSVLEKGDITIAVSTKGKSPALNKVLKKKINDTIGDEYIYLADLLGKIRSKVIENISDLKQRSKLFDSLVQNSDILELIKNNKHHEAEQLALKIFDKYISQQP